MQVISQVVTGGLHWSPSDYMSPQISRTLLSILTNLICHSLFSRFLKIVPHTPIMIGIIVTFMFQNFFSSLEGLGGLFVQENYMHLIVQDRFWFVHIPSSAWPNFSLLHISQWITFPTHSSLLLYSFWASSLPSLIIWFTVSSLSPHKLYLLFFSVSTFFSLI